MQAYGNSACLGVGLEIYRTEHLRLQLQLQLRRGGRRSGCRDRRCGSLHRRSHCQQSAGWTGIIHADNLDNAPTPLIDFLNEAKANCDNGDEIDIWIGGGEASEIETVTLDRQTAWMHLTSFFPNAAPADWNDTPGTIVAIVAPSAPPMIECKIEDI
ncbi:MULTISPECIES: hypothetical protein [unclassified Caulobacter]|uniref:hypothetical protein n=1 Tax=unclassified Caulobacter TaxID=2648921 RepID=UPI0011B82BA3|nr:MULTISPECIES: hypothetical protein [unclassified Caulobacter]